MNRNKKVRVFIYENKPGTHTVDHSGQHYVVDNKGCRRKVLVDNKGKPCAYDIKQKT